MFAVDWLTVGIKLHYLIQCNSLTPPPARFSVFQQWGISGMCVTADKPHPKLPLFKRHRRKGATDAILGFPVPELQVSWLSRSQRRRRRVAGNSFLYNPAHFSSPVA